MVERRQHRKPGADQLAAVDLERQSARRDDRTQTYQQPVVAVGHLEKREAPQTPTPVRLLAAGMASARSAPRDRHDIGVWAETSSGSATRARCLPSVISIVAVDRIRNVQAATSGRGAQVGVRTREQICADLQRGRKVDRVIATKPFLFGEIAGQVHEPFSDLHNRELLPQTHEFGLGASQLDRRESPPPRRSRERRARLYMHDAGSGHDGRAVPNDGRAHGALFLDQ